MNQDQGLEDCAIMILLGALLYRFRDNLLVCVSMYALLWYVSGGIVIPAVCLAGSGIAYGIYRLACWQPGNNVPTLNCPAAESISSYTNWDYLYQPRQNVPSFDSVMAQWNRLHGAQEPFDNVQGHLAPTPNRNRAIHNRWVSMRVTDVLCLDGNHAFTAGGCRSSKCECQCHLGQQWRQENSYVPVKLPDDPPF